MDSFIYRCSECNKEFERDSVRYLCPECGPESKQGQPLHGVLETIFDYDSIKRLFNPEHPDWNLLCAVEPEYHPIFPVGGTPYFRVESLGQQLGLLNLFIKNEGLNPSGSLKDRASELVVAEAIRLGERRIVTASTGNAAAALASVCAATDREAIIFVPAAAPRAKLTQMLVHGARVVRVKGSYDDAFRLSLEFTEKNGGLNRNTAYHPLTIEGKKTVAFEIYAQNGRIAPDVVMVPVGDGVIIAAVHKGFTDLLRIGLIDKLPRLISVQAESSDAIHRYVQTGIYQNADHPDTIADSISVSAPSNAHLAKRAIDESKGTSITVSDEEIIAAQIHLAQTTGVFAEPAAASTLAGVRKGAVKDFKKNDTVVLLITGHGLKNIDSVQGALNIPEPIALTLEAAERELLR
jgi:threonine synthase